MINDEKYIPSFSAIALLHVWSEIKKFSFCTPIAAMSLPAHMALLKRHYGEGKIILYLANKINLMLRHLLLIIAIVFLSTKQR